MTVKPTEAKPCVRRNQKHITLTMPPGTDAKNGAQVIPAWDKSLLHDVVPTITLKWQPMLKVHMSSDFFQRMKTLLPT